VDTDTCILCGECATTCKATGYNAIEWDKENPSYPIVDEKKCTGCGACENRCHRVNVLARRLDQSAIRVRPC